MPEQPTLRRVGHKGADHIAPGNTAASFDAAVAAGVDMIEFDVLPEDMHRPQDSSNKNGQRCWSFELADRSDKNYIVQCNTTIASPCRCPSWAFPP